MEEFLRGKTLHGQHVVEVAEDPTRVSETGVTGPSMLNDLGCFHLTQNYNPDIMHDLVEEVYPYKLKTFAECLHTGKEVRHPWHTE